MPCIFIARRFQLFPRRLASNCCSDRNSSSSSGSSRSISSTLQYCCSPAVHGSGMYNSGMYNSGSSRGCLSPSSLPHPPTAQHTSDLDADGKPNAMPTYAFVNSCCASALLLCDRGWAWLSGGRGVPTMDGSEGRQGAPEVRRQVRRHHSVSGLGGR